MQTTISHNSKSLSLRVSRDTYAELARFANSTDQSISNAARQILLAWARDRAKNG